jgi:hypothetical protein
MFVACSPRDDVVVERRREEHRGVVVEPREDLERVA